MPPLSLKLFAGPCEFVLSVAKTHQLPKTQLPEIAFWGRSNVGKSSLINGLLNRKSLARTSNTPGRTQQINLFNLGDKLMLADLPGYGYAKVSKSAQRHWEKLIDEYLQTRANLSRVFLLIDARHELKAIDRDVMDFLDEIGTPYTLVLTKWDAAKKPAKEAHLKNFEASNNEDQKTLFQRHPALFSDVFYTSARKKTGMEALRKHILSVV